MITLGSAFSGIGGFELGLERSSIPDLRTIWQIEKNEFCRKVLARHWPNALRYNDIEKLDYSGIEVPDILCAGFPCQDISVAGKQAGLKGENSGLWYNLFELIGILRPRIVLLENVPNVVNLGLPQICGAMAEIGYDMQWGIVSAASMGAPHLRRRWFAVAYPCDQWALLQQKSGQHKEKVFTHRLGSAQDASYSPCKHRKKNSKLSKRMEEEQFVEYGSGENRGFHPGNYWKGFPVKSGICRRDDGIPNRLDRIRSLGNAIVPACSEYVGNCLVDSGLIDHLIPRAICGGEK
tara:strand:+ start:1849 stop:2727 length:879 start_codon:yes stop_codon:yes gene_type:complete